MTAHSPDSPRDSLQSMLARLRGMVQALNAPDEAEPTPEEVLPTWDVPSATELPSAPSPFESSRAASPPADEAAPMPGALAEPLAPTAVPPEMPEATPDDETASPISMPGESAPWVEPTPATTEPVAPAYCPFCQEPRAGSQSYCENCGLIFPPDLPTSPSSSEDQASPPPKLLAGRYQLGQRLGERGSILRYRAVDHDAGRSEGVQVLIVQALHTSAVESLPAAEPVSAAEEAPIQDSEFLEAFPESAEATLLAAVAQPSDAGEPRLAWESAVLSQAQHPTLPRLLDHFVEEGFAYLVVEWPVGRALWDAWDDPKATSWQRFGWLRQLAEALQNLHRCGALLEALPPESVVVTPEGQARLTDLADLLPMPLPPNAPIRATYYTAPELILRSEQADARANLYTFGALLYALHVGRELVETDFEMQGTPKPLLGRFPDVHPLLGRLLSKTFCRDLHQRFPTEESAREDPTGFAELIRTLEVCRRTLDRVRLDIAAWTTTGMVRTGNEDALAVLHAVESRQDDLAESALVLLADGMGGYEFGEIAAALAIQVLRANLLRQRLFAALAGESGFLGDDPRTQAHCSASEDVDTPKKLLAAALKEANQQVYRASRRESGRGGMGCTAEAVYVDGWNLFVGHVGDSRTYHLHQGRLIQVTRDQTLVNRLVELGLLTPEEAENHPRRSELQQAIGGQPDVEPGLYHAPLKPGDWVVVCSDGLPSHVSANGLREMLLSARSAEAAARHLVNLVNLAGATDNATVVAIRAT